MPFDGTIEGFALTDIVQIISVGRLTGIATATCDDKTVKLVFKSGRLIHANEQTQRRLGKRLVDGGYLSQECLDTALEEQKSKRHHTPLATLLVEMNLVDQVLLEAETERHIKDVFDDRMYDEEDPEVEQELLHFLP
jgi:hypothetical protein